MFEGKYTLGEAALTDTLPEPVLFSKQYIRTISLEASISTAVSQNYELYQGDHAVVIFVREESTLTGIDDLFWKAKSGGCLIPKRWSEDEIEIVDGNVKIELTPEETNTETGTHPHELRMIVGEDVHTMAKGAMTIEETLIENIELTA